MDYRSYVGGDEAALVACWARSLRKDQVSLGRFVRTTLLDDNFDEAGLIEARDSQGEVRGFVHAVAVGSPEGLREGPAASRSGRRDGWILVLAVDPACQRQGIGRELLRRAEQYLVGRGCSRAVVSPYPPGYYYPGVPVGRYPGSCELFEDGGYHKSATVVAMDRLLVDYEVPEVVAKEKWRLEADGWRFGSPSVEWYTRLLGLCGSFVEDWASVVRVALRHGARPEQIQVATYGDEIAGFAIFGAYLGCPDRFGPFGVLPERRRLGLGNVLLHETLREMAAQSLHCAWFLWTGEEDAAGRLYRRAGFEVSRRFAIYERAFGGTGTL
ncbi:MAG TPA: GNAT family N-acetyltransferase [Acidimicrobiales bacterium]|nr:GNAT family N-acetyltransferase [Acidimicrobiales bacterium]